MSDPVRASRLAERVRGVLGSASANARPLASSNAPTVSTASTGLPVEPPAVSGVVPRHVPSAGAGSNRAAAGADALERALGGSWTEDSGTRCFVVERRVPPDERCGALRVGDVAERLLAASTPVRWLAGGAEAAPPYLFFDLETTGLSGGAGTYAFLVGCASFDSDGAFLFRQFVVSHPRQERAMLQRLSGEVRRAGALVSFNGRSFDAPLLEMRYAFHRLAWPGEEKPHLDVLHPARRFWSTRGKGQDGSARAYAGLGDSADESARARGDGAGASQERSCSLVTLEQHVLGVAREGDVPGAEVPMRYFDFMRSGDARLLAPVLEHNRRDLLSLAALMARLLHLLDEGPAIARTPREALALGRLYERTDADRARDAYLRAVESSRSSDPRSRTQTDRDVRAEAQRALALMARRRRQYDEAAGWWRGVLRDTRRGSGLAREAAAALAVHAEHREGDLAAAKRFALDSRMAGGPGWERAVSRRLARLDRKLAGAPGAGAQLLEPTDGVEPVIR